MPESLIYNEKAIPANNTMEMAKPAPKKASDLCELIRECHTETSDILATIYCLLTGNTPKVPEYGSPESMLMDLGNEADRAACIRQLVMDIRNLL